MIEEASVYGYKNINIDLSPENWHKWKAGQSFEIAKAEQVWEGVEEPIIPSIRGEIGFAAHQCGIHLSSKKMMIYFFSILVPANKILVSENFL